MSPRQQKPLISLLLTAGLLLAGCKSASQAQPAAGSPAIRGEAAPPATNSQLAAMLARLDALESDNTSLRRELGARDRAEIEARRLLAQSTDRPAAAERPAPPAVPDMGRMAEDQEQGTTHHSAIALDEASADDLLAALSDRIHQGADPPLVAALKAAALSMLSRRHELDYALVDALGPADREQAVRFHQMMAVTFEEIATGSRGDLTRREVVERVDEVFGAQPLQIQAVELCRRVDGYGIYTPLPTHRFLVGRHNALNGGSMHDAVMYLELENFVRRELSDGTYEVKVSWELALYDRDGAVVLWRQPPTVVTDVSRNRRRDFFLAQTIDLPPNLQGGGYLLEIRVIDQNSGARHEKTLSDIEFVADPGLIHE